MTTSPRKRRRAGCWGLAASYPSAAGKLRTSVALSWRRDVRLRRRRWRSLTSAMLTVPRARDGAARRSHRARPDAGSGRPRASPTTTRKRPRASSGMRTWSGRLAPIGGGAAIARRPRRLASVPGAAGRRGGRLVRLHDLPHQLVPHDVAIVEVDERDALDRVDDLNRLDEPGGLAARQIDLRH